jgi:Ca2+-binding RTX toxin-like protein
MHLGDGDNVVIGGAFNDTIESGDGNDIVAGDSVEIYFIDASTSPESITSLDTGIGGNDGIVLGEGNNTCIGGAFDDTITSGSGRDIVAGDSVVIKFSTTDALATHMMSLDVSIGGRDIMKLGDGDNIGIGGADDDIIECGTGNDIVAGDSVEIHFISTSTSPLSITSLHTSIGGNDNITLSEGDNIAIGGASNDNITSGSGRDIVAGDSVFIDFSPTDALATNITSLDPSIGGDDIMELGDGDNVGIGGAYNDTIECGTGNDIVAGDSVEIYFIEASTSPESITSLDTGIGGNDDIFLSEGNNTCIGGAFDDTITSGSGRDIVAGDSVVIEFSTTDALATHMTSLDASIGGHDIMKLGDGDNIGIGGADDDTIECGTGNDIVVGDSVEMFFIEASISLEFMTSLDTSIGGHDEIFLGEGDNICIGGAFDDTITSGSGRDIVAGDSVAMAFSPTDALATNLTSLDASIGGYDTMHLGDGDNVGIGGAFDDTIECGIGNDTVAGDSVEIYFIATSTSPWSITSLNTIIGGNDDIILGEGNNIGIGGAFDDTITSGSGRDIVAGDSVVIEFSLSDALATNMTSLDTGVGGYDNIELGDGDNVGIGGAYDDKIQSGDGNDIVAGDSVEILFFARSTTPESIISLTTSVGGGDEIVLGDGDNIGIGGAFNDTITSGDGRDILVGDSVSITFHDSTEYPHTITSLSCDGGDDTLFGGGGSVDYLIGGAYNDTIYGEGGPDLAFGDHAEITLNEIESHKLVYAETIQAECTGGDDLLIMGDGDDIVFGGAYSDTIYGNAGQDVLFGGKFSRVDM